MIEYFQHNFNGSNLCVFSMESAVCNPNYNTVARFHIKLKEGVKPKKYIKEQHNLPRPWWKENGGDVIKL